MMALTAQQIAKAYQDTVGAGLMSEAEFVRRAQGEFGATVGQLTAARDILTGAAPEAVQNNLRALPQQEVVNYLRATTPAQAQITPTQDLNAPGMATSAVGAGGEQFIPIYSQEAEGAPSQVVGYTRYLAEFDPTYEGGRYGSYVGVYDPQGNLTDVKFQQGERNAGALQEFATRYGYLLPLGAAALGAGGFLPDFTGANALDPFGAELSFGQQQFPGFQPPIDTEIFPGPGSGSPTTPVTAPPVGQPPPVTTAPPGIDEEIFPRTPTDPNIDRPPVVAPPPGGGTPPPGGGTPRVPGGGVTPTGAGTDWGQVIGQLANAFGGANAASAAREAAQIQAGLGREALALQREMFERQVGLQEPFRQGGLSAQNRLMDLLGLGMSPEQLVNEYQQRTGAGMSEADFVNWARSQGVSDNRLMQARNMLLVGPNAMRAGMSEFGSAARPFSMDAFRADPGYGFRLSEGLKALERSAAARGGLLSGGTGKALQRYGQDMASQEYGNAFNRFYTEREALLNPLLSLSGRGQTSATQTGQAAQSFGQQGAQSLTGIGNAMAAGQVGQANAINQAIGQGVSMYNQGQNQNLLNQVLARSMG